MLVRHNQGTQPADSNAGAGAGAADVSSTQANQLQGQGQGLQQQQQQELGQRMQQPGQRGQGQGLQRQQGQQGLGKRKASAAAPVNTAARTAPRTLLTAAAGTMPAAPSAQQLHQQRMAITAAGGQQQQQQFSPQGSKDQRQVLQLGSDPQQQQVLQLRQQQQQQPQVVRLGPNQQLVRLPDGSIAIRQIGGGEAGFEGSDGAGRSGGIPAAAAAGYAAFSGGEQDAGTMSLSTTDGRVVWAAQPPLHRVLEAGVHPTPPLLPTQQHKKQLQLQLALGDMVEATAMEAAASVYSVAAERNEVGDGPAASCNDP